MNDINIQSPFVTEIADLGRILGNAHRLNLLEHIAQGERSVERLAELSNVSVANTSQHLQHLRRAGLVQSRRMGKHVLYGLGTGPILKMLASLRQYAEHRHIEIQELVTDSLNGQNRLEGLSVDELQIRLAEGNVVLLDVRPEEEFLLGHLPGALNIPVEDLQGRINELPTDREIVAYCRGTYCVLSVDAVTALRAKGLTAHRLKNGFVDWKGAGLEVEEFPKN
ncbi:MAG: metalloregulator ArsR/SmtB family transcription factor [Sneathiella sp.]